MKTRTTQLFQKPKPFAHNLLQTSRNSLLMNQISMTEDQMIPSQLYKMRRTHSRASSQHEESYSLVNNLKDSRMENYTSKQLIEMANKEITKKKKNQNHKDIEQIIREVMHTEEREDNQQIVNENRQKVFVRKITQPQNKNKLLPEGKHLNFVYRNVQIEVARPNVIFKLFPQLDEDIEQIPTVEQKGAEKMLIKHYDDNFENYFDPKQLKKEQRKIQKNVVNKFEQISNVAKPEQSRYGNSSFYFKEKEIKKIQTYKQPKMNESKNYDHSNNPYELKNPQNNEALNAQNSYYYQSTNYY